MDDTEELFNQIGLILTQLRYSRRALEDIERSTARYGGFAFASALSAGPSFGAPPLLNGALKVYVVNIHDLTPGTGIGGFIQGLLGGIGRFFGGLIGGIAGGTVSSITLPAMIFYMDRIVGGVQRILDRLNIGNQGSSAAGTAGREASASTPSTGGNLMDQLGSIRQVVNAFTALFQAASGGPEQAAGTSPLAVTPAGQWWMTFLTTARGVISGISNVVNGLILLIPILIGSLVLFIQRLDAIKLAVIEMLQFILRNVFLLRGVLLTTIADTAAALARLAGNILGILATAIESILGAIFRMVGYVLSAAVAAIEFIATGLQNTVDRMLRWIVSTLGAVLNFIGDLRIFRVLVHIIRIIPSVLPPLYNLIRSLSSTPPPPLTSTQLTNLQTAAALPIPGPSRTGSPAVTIPPFPSLADAIAPAARVRLLSESLATATRGLTGELSGVLGTAGSTLVELGGELNRVAERETRLSNDRLQGNLSVVQERSAQLADALRTAHEAASRPEATGLEPIARAYEQWLSGQGFSTLLNNITEHFRSTPPAEPGTIPRRIAAETVERPRATVEIQNVSIQIEPLSVPAEGEGETGAVHPPAGERGQTLMICNVLRELRELEERGFRWDSDDICDLLILEPTPVIQV